MGVTTNTKRVKHNTSAKQPAWAAIKVRCGLRDKVLRRIEHEKNVKPYMGTIRYGSIAAFVERAVIEKLERDGSSSRNGSSKKGGSNNKGGTRSK